MKEYRLECQYDSAQSFGGKAIVIRDDTKLYLRSYETLVAMWDMETETLYRKQGQPQSNTTARHMREFAMQRGLPYMTKSQLKELPTKWF